MRNLARRQGVVLVFVFMCSTLLALIPPPTSAAVAMHHQHAAGHGMDLSLHHDARQQPTNHHHGLGGCCLMGQHCTSNCIFPLAEANDFSLGHTANEAPLVHLTAQALTRPPQPPRRPPKA